MGKPLRNINKIVYNYAKAKFKEMLKAGAFPKIQYKYSECSESYAMMEYSTVWARFSKIVHNKLIERGYEYGIWQNSRNAKFTKDVDTVVSGVTEDLVNQQPDRFKTWCD